MIEPEIMPVSIVPLKFAFVMLQPVRITPTSEVFEKFTFVRFEF